jgi:predicted MFS family arabinose efflux permease
MQGGLVGRLSRRIAEPRLAIAGPLLLAVGLAATPFMSPGVGLLAALTAVSFGQGIASPVLASLISKSGGGAKRGEVLGVSQSLGSLARVVGPVWGGLLFDYAGGRGTYLATAALLAGAAAMATHHGTTTAAPDETATT